MARKWKSTSSKVKKITMIGVGGRPVRVYVPAEMSTRRYNALMRARTKLRKK